MDQNSTNGAGADKRNWRERLGIGGKDMPRLSEEFRAPPQPSPASPPAAGSARPAPRAPQPVTKPAPMAPRPGTARAAPAAPSNPPPRPSGETTVQDALAEKLRAQRAAAEKLAEQRVQAARERAEGKSRPAEPQLQAPSRTAPPPAAPAGGRPKFSFAEEEPVARKETRAEPVPPRPPLTPPRPALGGERAQPPFLRPAAPSTTSRSQPPLRSDPQPPYRPADPNGGYQPRYQPPAGRSYAAPDASPYGAARPPVRRPAADPYARGGYAGDDQFEDDPRAQPRLTRAPAPRSRGRAPADDYDEVFDDEPAPRQRASARDYQAAYRETEGAYEDEQSSSRGSWLLLAGLLALAFITAAMIWAYNTKFKTTTPTAATTSEQAPIVAAPEQPAKVAPEQPADSQAMMPAARKKQIYDRIVGDQEVTGEQVVPTEETPVQPANIVPEATGQQVPEQGAAPIPAPDAQGAAIPDPAAAPADEPVPLPLPPPPGNDVQGSLDQQGVERIAAAAAKPDTSGAAPPGAASAGSTSNSAVAALPPPEPDTEGAVSASDDVVEAPAPKPVTKKKAASNAEAAPAKKKAAAASEENFGAEPVVLVPPSQGAAASPTQSDSNFSEPVSQQGATAPAPATKKRKTLFDLFNGDSSSGEGAAAPAPQQDTQVASLEPAKKQQAPQPAPAQQASSGGSGYLVQLSTFRSENEARQEYNRLRGQYPDVVGSLSPRIGQTSVGGSTRYRLGLGPVASRDQATNVCNSLFSGGERDCLVRSQ